MGRDRGGAQKRQAQLMELHDWSETEREHLDMALEYGTVSEAIDFLRAQTWGVNDELVADLWWVVYGVRPGLEEEA